MSTYFDEFIGSLIAQRAEFFVVGALDEARRALEINTGFEERTPALPSVSIQ